METEAVSSNITGLTNMPWLFFEKPGMNSTTTNSTIKLSNRKLNMKNLITTKYLIYYKRNWPQKVPKHFRTHEKHSFKTK